MITHPLQTISIAPIEVRVEPMLRIQGYKDISRVRTKIKKIASQMARLSIHTFQPAVSFIVHDISNREGDRLVLGNGSEFHSPAFSHFLNQCDQIAAFVLTVGPAIDDQLKNFNATDRLIEALFLESASWLGLEHLTKQLVQLLRKTAIKNGQSVTRRISPGYSFQIKDKFLEWPLHEQQSLFDSFGEHKLPVKVLESGAMLPKMSRSGIYGIRRCRSQ